MVIFTKKFGTLDPHQPIVWDKVPKKTFFWDLPLNTRLNEFLLLISHKLDSNEECLSWLWLEHELKWRVDFSVLHTQNYIYVAVTPAILTTKIKEGVYMFLTLVKIDETSIKLFLSS